MRKSCSYIAKDLETGLYIGTVPSIPGAYTQAETLEELYKNLQEVVQLCLVDLTIEERKPYSEPEFIALQYLKV